MEIHVHVCIHNEQFNGFKMKCFFSLLFYMIDCWNIIYNHINCCKLGSGGKTAKQNPIIKKGTCMRKKRLQGKVIKSSYDCDGKLLWLIKVFTHKGFVDGLVSAPRLLNNSLSIVSHRSHVHVCTYNSLNKNIWILRTAGWWGGRSSLKS